MNPDHHDSPPVTAPTNRDTRLRRWLNAFAPIRELGRFHDAPAHLADWHEERRAAHTRSTRAEPLRDTLLEPFFTQTQRLLAATDDEPARRQLEDAVLALAERLHAAGLFELIRLRHAGLQSMIDDHLAAVDVGSARCSG